MKTKALLKSFALCLIAIFTVSAHAQISTNELPPSFSSSLFSIRSGDVINLPIPDVAEALHEDSLFADADIPGGKRQKIPVYYNTAFTAEKIFQFIFIHRARGIRLQRSSVAVKMTASQ